MTSTQTRAVSMTDKIALIDQWCSAARILPVITIEREADILPLADAPPPVASRCWKSPCARLWV